jgi:hypothetical protein
VTLTWAFALAIDSLIVYGVRPDAATSTDLTLTGCEVTLYNAGRVVKVFHVVRHIDPDGTEFGCDGLIADRVEIRPAGARGRIGGVRRIGLAEISAMARIPED